MTHVTRMLLALCITVVVLPVYAQMKPQPETPHSTIGYNSVKDALAAVRANPNIKIHIVRGWIIAVNKKAKTIWSFAPKGDPSYPSVVKRVVTSASGGSTIAMDVECEASKKACDNLVRDFEALDKRAFPYSH